MIDYWLITRMQNVKILLQQLKPIEICNSSQWSMIAYQLISRIQFLCIP